jgi:effector-binding domain-containing protein
VPGGGDTIRRAAQPEDAAMSLDNQPKEKSSGLRGLAAQWPLLAALAVLVAFGAIYLERKFFPPPAPVVGAPQKPIAADEKKATPGETTENKGDAAVEAQAESVTSQTVEVAARPALVMKGQAKWDDAAKTLSESIAKMAGAAQKAGLAANGRPLTVFTETDDNGFHYEAMLPLAKAPEGKPKLPDGVDVGASPSGKALKFQHRGSYDEIDATYEAITAYLDEKGLDTKNLFIEEYLTDLKLGEESDVEVDIYVFLK